jgi:hypothetical protein
MLSCSTGGGEKVRRALAVLKSFISGVKVSLGDVEIGLDIDPEKGSADSGDLEVDLSVRRETGRRSRGESPLQ